MSLIEREITALRQRPERERLEVVREAFAVDALRGVSLARALKSRRSYEEVLRLGVSFANPSEMRPCVDLVVPRLGLSRFAAVLATLDGASRVGVESALYWARAWPTDDITRAALERVLSRVILMREASHALERVLEEFDALHARTDLDAAEVEALRDRLMRARKTVARDLGEEAA